MGPTLPISIETHALKYQTPGEDFRAFSARLADSMKDCPKHFQHLLDLIRDDRFLFAGRVRASMGAPRRTTAFNCFVSDTIPDSMQGIMRVASQAAETMRMGGGIGYDFSTIRPAGDVITTVGAPSSGPVSFMHIFDAVCKTVASAGGRRGAQMGVLRVDHPDIEAFIEAKQDQTSLTQFNISIGVTDEFMAAVMYDREFNLKFNNKLYKRIAARPLWEKIMRATWDWAEPGILFIDRINQRNNLWGQEKIVATNPCAEQPLPPHGACLLGSFNLVKYIKVKPETGERYFDYIQFTLDIPAVVRALDNVIDRTTYPLPEQEQEAKNKRRMGIGVTGVANAFEALGMPYGSPEFLRMLDRVLEILSNETYRASALLAFEKGRYPLYSENEFMGSYMASMLHSDTLHWIKLYGLRNSHLTSVAPTGTISLCADNISSGIEPVFSESYTRKIRMPDGSFKIETVTDYGVRVFGVKPKVSSEVTVEEHLSVLATTQKWIDSSVSKTINLSGDESWEDFKNVYLEAWKRGCKGCTTFNPKGKRFGILVAEPTHKPEEPSDEQGGACYFDPETGRKSCE